MATKLVTVFGATGAQGGSVVQALLRDKSGTFKIRGITRNPASEAAKALADSGVEVVKADGLNISELVPAFEGSWAVFVNINSDDPCLNQKDGPSETDMGKIIIDAALEAGVQHFVFSGMASASEITNGAVPNQAFDEKHAIGQHGRSKAFTSFVDVSPGWYMESFLWPDLAPVFGGFPFNPDEEGHLTFTCPRWGGPNDEAPFIAMAADYGDMVHGVLLAPEKYNGRLIQGLSQSRSLESVIPDYQTATGKKARFRFMETWEELETYGMSGLVTVQRMFGFCQYSGGLYYGLPNDTMQAAELKAAAATAQGKTGDDAKLMTLERFFKQHLA
ncbi:NAD(P)-binding protein [Sodiomyces alkalinus F11]|uniref:NAD(P)-binding protein n=1 Tax=Sodiomyces alkalinus (strain CBS 110278 / VKM F-3762 / F11) TaxID=1314773 RepID=A0A3N2PSU0_SODAK|nr:NAD(P)-binding protein [Sodiomyces alkalinus F11]ROT37484.1 NAD(P)-binding protein [Sodiomyces alkalinus F11]